MTATTLLQELQRRGATVGIERGELAVGPESVLDAALIDALREREGDIVALLREWQHGPSVCVAVVEAEKIVTAHRPKPVGKSKRA